MCRIFTFRLSNVAEQLLLGYLPMDRGLWSSELAKKRSQYKHFKEELLMNPVSQMSYVSFLHTQSYRVFFPRNIAKH